MASYRMRFLLLAMFAPVLPAQAATYVVNVTHDNASDCSGSGSCTLRGALAAAAANPGMDRIEFSLAQFSVIAPLTPFPTITHQVIIDARPDPAYDGHAWVYLDGLATTDADGLRFGNGAASSAVYAMGFNHWDDAGIELAGTANQVRIDGCYFGRSTIGGVAGNGNGIVVLTNNNVIGQEFIAGVGYRGAGNLVIGSSGNGLLLTGDGNLVRGNNFGELASSSGNEVGIRLLGGTGNVIGEGGAGNNVYYSAGAGIIINGGGNVVRGNYVGTNSGNSVRPNGGAGIEVSGAGNIIGGTGSGERNTIAYNGTGILLGTPGNADDTHVIGNRVRANVGTGIRVLAGTGNLIEDNLVDGNGTGGVGDGIRLDGDDNTVIDNEIGQAQGNNGEGVFLSTTANGNTVGPGNTLLRNRSGVKLEGTGNAVIGNDIGAEGAGNANDGVWVVAGANNTLVEENRINGNGLSGIRVSAADCDVVDNAIGSLSGNADHGIRLTASSSGAFVGPQNKIGSHGLDGIAIEGTGHQVVENRIGSLPPGIALPNARHGIHVLAGAGAARIERNRIGHNGGDGIRLAGGPSSVILGNEIGGYQGSSSYVAIGNGGDGIFVQGADGVHIGDGSTEGRNLLLYNGEDGIAIAGASGTVVDGNLLAANLLSGMALFTGVEDTLVFRTEIRENFRKAIHVASDAGLRNTFRNNAMIGNVVPGIDLAGDGPSANDPADADEGPNRMQNSPVLLFHAPEGADGLEVGYSVDADPGNVAYPLRVEFYASGTPQGGGPSREGNAYLGAATYAAPGVASATVAAPTPGFDWLLALATDDEGNTSEFSAAIALQVNAEPAIFANGFED